ncbi:MAG: hypothetical protein JWN36_1794 [Microbacteriaceae bacterium]|nr:hypothetical protein [Microbacteriaceae bacterium]
MRVKHDDPAIEHILVALEGQCAWTVEYRDSQFVCLCTRHKYTVRVPTMGQWPVDPAAIRLQLNDFDCVELG